MRTRSALAVLCASIAGPLWIWANSSAQTQPSPDGVNLEALPLRAPTDTELKQATVDFEARRYDRSCIVFRRAALTSQEWTAHTKAGECYLAAINAELAIFHLGKAYHYCEDKKFCGALKILYDCALQLQADQHTIGLANGRVNRKQQVVDELNTEIARLTALLDASTLQAALEAGAAAAERANALQLEVDDLIDEINGLKDIISKLKTRQTELVTENLKLTLALEQEQMRNAQLEAEIATKAREVEQLREQLVAQPDGGTPPSEAGAAPVDGGIARLSDTATVSRSTAMPRFAE